MVESTYIRLLVQNMSTLIKLLRLTDSDIRNIRVSAASIGVQVTLDALTTYF